MASDRQVQATTPGGAARAAASAPVELTRVYAGAMTMSGSFSDSLGQKGTFAGTLTDTLYATVDSTGTGEGYETFTGVLTDGHLHDHRGRTIGQPCPRRLGLRSGWKPGFARIDRLHAQSHRRQGASQTNGATSVIAVNPLSITGILSRQFITVTKTVAPFRNIAIGDLLFGEVDSIKITVSNPNNGKLEPLSGGAYNKSTGVYVIHANAETATDALRGLKFAPTTAAGSPTTTSFTISVENAGGAIVTNGKTTITAHSAAPGATADTGVMLFGQYVAAGLHGMPDRAAGLLALHDLPQSSHLELAVGHR